MAQVETGLSRTRPYHQHLGPTPLPSWTHHPCCLIFLMFFCFPHVSFNFGQNAPPSRCTTQTICTANRVKLHARKPSCRLLQFFTAFEECPERFCAFQIMFVHSSTFQLCCLFPFCVAAHGPIERHLPFRVAFVWPLYPDWTTNAEPLFIKSLLPQNKDHIEPLHPPLFHLTETPNNLIKMSDNCGQINLVELLYNPINN